MTLLFWFALVLGGGLLLVSTLGHLLGDVLGDHADGPADASAQLDSDTDQPASAAHANVDHEGFRFLSLRTITYFLFAFGACGVLLTYAWRGTLPLAAGAFALGCGALSAYLSARIFQWVGAGDSGALAGDRALVGATGVVSLPLVPHGTGKVLVHTAGRELELLARPVEDVAGDPAEWKDVLVVDVTDGVAVVTPFEHEE